MAMKISKKSMTGVTTKPQEELALTAQVVEEPVGIATTDIIHPDGSEESTQEQVFENLEAENPAYLTIQMGLTRNLGDFESLKMLVGLVVKCNNTPEEIEVAYGAAKEWVDNKVSEINAEVDEQLKG